MAESRCVRVIDTAFMEVASSEPETLIAMFERLGFRLAGRHRSQRISWLRQGGVNIIVNGEAGSHGEQFAQVHGPSCAGMHFSG